MERGLQIKGKAAIPFSISTHDDQTLGLWDRWGHGAMYLQYESNVSLWHVSMLFVWGWMWGCSEIVTEYPGFSTLRQGFANLFLPRTFKYIPLRGTHFLKCIREIYIFMHKDPFIGSEKNSIIAWYYIDNMLFPKLNNWLLYCHCSKVKSNY